MRAKTPASERQKKFASDLGLKFSPDITFGDMHRLLDAEVEAQSLAALENNPNLSVESSIMYKGNPYRIAEIEDKHWKLRIVPCGTWPGARQLRVMILSVKDAAAAE